MTKRRSFRSKVIQYFADEYKAGRTPNPCVMCNQNLKFGRLIDRADQLGAQYIATGHFARRGDERDDGPRRCSSAGAILRKDQSYFLFSLRQDQLARAMFPLGEKTKSDTREVARHCKLKTADKEESMEICFVPDNDYGKFLQQAKLVQKHRGEIVDLHGHVLGHHDGIEFYTIGQRKGLGISSPKPLYVIELDAANNRVSSAMIRRWTATSSRWSAATGFPSTRRRSNSKPRRRFATTIPARRPP